MKASETLHKLYSCQPYNDNDRYTSHADHLAHHLRSPASLHVSPCERPVCHLAGRHDCLAFRYADHYDCPASRHAERHDCLACYRDYQKGCCDCLHADHSVPDDCESNRQRLAHFERSFCRLRLDRHHRHHDAPQLRPQQTAKLPNKHIQRSPIATSCSSWLTSFRLHLNIYHREGNAFRLLGRCVSKGLVT